MGQTPHLSSGDMGDVGFDRGQELMEKFGVKRMCVTEFKNALCSFVIPICICEFYLSYCSHYYFDHFFHAQVFLTTLRLFCAC